MCISMLCFLLKCRMANTLEIINPVQENIFIVGILVLCCMGYIPKTIGTLKIHKEHRAD